VSNDLSTDRFIAVDFGSSHIKVAVGSTTGQPDIVVRTPVNYFHPVDAPETALEFEPGQTLTLIIETIQRALAESEIETDLVKGIGITSQRQGLVLIGFEQQVLYGGPNKDLRAIFEGGEIDSDPDVDLWELTGHGPGMLTAWARIKWFSENMPRVFEKMRVACSISDWIGYELTGELLLDQTQGVESGLAMLATGAGADGIASQLGLSQIELPADVPSGTTIGNLKNELADQLGLDRGTRVVTCGPDTQTGLIGLGVQLPHATGIVAGWSTAVQRVLDRPVLDDTRAMWTGRHVLPNRWVLEGNAGETGGTYWWLMELLYGSATDEQVMNTVDKTIGDLPAGESGITSFLGPAFTNMANLGLRTGGILFPVPISFEPPDRLKLLRSALENFAFGIRHNVERLNSFRGPTAGIAVGGGMVKTNSFSKILASVLGSEIKVAPSGEATSAGTLSITASAIGRGPSLAEIALVRSSELEKVAPTASESAIYEDMYHEWRHKERMLENLEL